MKIKLQQLNVGLIINMCYEFNGLKDYNHFNITQHHVPTPDFAQPNYYDILKSIQYIRLYHKNNPNKKIFIHCKGGRSRAVTMTLSYLITNGMNEQIAMKLIKNKRNVAEIHILEFQCIKKLIDNLKIYNNNFDKLFENEMKNE